MSLQIRPVFFTRELSQKFFSKIMPESWGCGLYTSAAYTQEFTVVIFYLTMSMGIVKGSNKVL